MANPQYYHSHFHQLRAILNRTYAFLNVLATAPILYYRVAFLFNPKNDHYYYYGVPLFAWLLVFATEILLSFTWILKQSYYWRPVTRTVFPEKLPKDEDLPGIDVFICTADPIKEPTFDVMNTVISSMSLDYPADKLSVYVSDDGGASVTLNAMKHAWVFATWWLPFCRRYNIHPICPKAYFEQHSQENSDISHSMGFIQDAKVLKEKYENFKEGVRSCKDRIVENVSNAKKSAQNHKPTVQVISENFVGDDAATINTEAISMPLLVYLAREKRPSHPHHFKAGALNVLQRVSSILSNAPYILVLDCDMYCNDSISARQAMCFHIDPVISSSLAWVQYPQKFHNISETDIYDSQMKTIWPVIFPGIDGIQGPIVAGTNFYIKRKALYGFNNEGSIDIDNQRCTFGSSNLSIKSLSHDKKPCATGPGEISSDCLREAHFLASCVYEEETQWGKKVGFRYDSVAEDVTTGCTLHGQGWKSAYLNPSRPQFLGSATTNLNETLVQGSRWTVGLLQLGLSKYFLFRNSPRMPILQRMAYAWFAFYPLDFLPISCFAIVPPICFFYGIPLYPKVSDPFFIPFAFVFVSSHVKHLCEVVFLSSGSVNTWMNEQRIMMIKCLTCYAYGFFELIMDKLGIRKKSFLPTNKAGDDDSYKWYYIGKYDFRTSNMFLVPIVTAVTLNLSAFVAGVARVVVAQSWDAHFAQVFFSFYVLIMSIPVVEGMLLRTDNACIPLRTTLISTLLSGIVLSLGYYVLL